MLRKELRKKLDGLSPEERRRRSDQILKRVLIHPRFVSADSFLTYVALASEVETRPLVEEGRRRGKRVYVPRVDPVRKKIWMIEIRDLKELKPGSHGILEPPFEQGRVENPQELELAVVPGLAFDRGGGRLGRGGGYFDRFLKSASGAYKIGLAFEFQMVEEVPREADDACVDEVLVG